MIGIVSKGCRHAGKHVLIGLSWQEIAVLQRDLAEIGQKIIARAVNRDPADDPQLRRIRVLPTLASGTIFHCDHIAS